MWWGTVPDSGRPRVQRIHNTTGRSINYNQWHFCSSGVRFFCRRGGEGANARGVPPARLLHMFCLYNDLIICWMTTLCKSQSSNTFNFAGQMPPPVRAWAWPWGQTAPTAPSHCCCMFADNILLCSCANMWGFPAQFPQNLNRMLRKLANMHNKILCHLFHGSCETGFMPLAACMVSLEFLLQLVKLSRPFRLSLQRLFQSFVMLLWVSIFSLSLLSFIDMSACSVVIVVCLFFICISCCYYCLLGVLNVIW